MGGVHRCSSRQLRNSTATHSKHTHLHSYHLIHLQPTHSMHRIHRSYRLCLSFPPTTSTSATGTTGGRTPRPLQRVPLASSASFCIRPVLGSVQVQVGREACHAGGNAVWIRLQQGLETDRFEGGPERSQLGESAQMKRHLRRVARVARVDQRDGGCQLATVPLPIREADEFDAFEDDEHPLQPVDR